MSKPAQRAEELFAGAMKITDGEARRDYLDRACADDTALRQEVESLLQAHFAAGDFLGRTVALPKIEVLTEKSGTRIGRYKLLEKIGEGGFGVVWMAEQEEPVRRRVALKIIKLGMDTKEVVARFEAERQALAMMDHPNIASIFDGGATETGRPFFVMELVKGIPITEYCDANKLATRERLDLFMQVCHAVQHAHQKGIIHRDLKPTNILVTVKDDRPVPKVIDFGVAKATQARLTEKTMFTQFRQLIGTPAYMSPEQAGLGSMDVDTRSDVYSLGVLLYELLTGQPPFDTRKLLEKGFDAVMRTIREDEPPKPSTRLSTMAAAELGKVAVQRQAYPAKLERGMRGDLDWIVMKALEKDRRRRYESASALADDLEHHLNLEPVSAAAPDFFYRAGKFIRRQRTPLAFAALVLFALVLAGAGGKFALNYQSARRAFQATGTNVIFSAAISGNLEELRRLLDANPQLVNQRDAGGSTPLAGAAGAGRTEAVRLLLARGAAVDATNHDGGTSLLQAATKGRTATVEVLLKAGANPNLADRSGVTALLAVSLSGLTNIGQPLLDQGARVDAVYQPAKITALQQTAMLGHAGFVALLLEHGARADQKDANGSTPLHGAATGLSGTDLIRAWNNNASGAARTNDADANWASAATAYSNQLAQAVQDMPESFVTGGRQHDQVAELLIDRGANLEATNRDGCTPLLTAVLYTNRQVVTVLITHRANLNARAKDGSTPLNLAAVKGDEVIAALLLNAGADPNLTDNAGFTALNTAVEQGHPAVAKMLLEHAANPNLACPDGQTPLHTAAGHGDIESMSLLMDHGAALHPLSPAGTPLTWAVCRRELAAVKFLLQRGAKPDVAPPQNGMTALHWAASLGLPDVAKLLLESGASVDADSSWQGTPLNAAAAGRAGAKKWLGTLYGGFPPGTKFSNPVIGSEDDYAAVLRVLLAAKANVNAREPRFERTPIFMAVSQGNAGAVDLLINAKADLAATDRLGLTPLHAASEMDASATGMSNILTNLLKAGASVSARDHFFANPLHAAANAGNPVMLALLLEAGARINTAGPNLCTPLQLAVMRNRRDVVELLLAQQPDLEWRNSYGTTALLQAVQLQSREMVELLLDHGADLTVGSTNGATALMVGAGNGDLGTMKLLLERGADVNATSMNGWTAFLTAAQEGKVEAGRLLLDHGAKFEVAEDTGFTPLIIAARGGHLEMVKFLLQRGAAIAAKNNAGFTALHEAADRGHAALVEFLLNQGTELEPTDDYQATPLHVAANGAFADEANYVAVVKVLLAHKANVNARMRGNQTPLHRAAFWGHPEIIQVLLAAGVDLNARDDDGKTALDLAKISDDSRLRPGVAAGRRECARLLLKSSTKSMQPSNIKETKQ